MTAEAFDDPVTDELRAWIGRSTEPLALPEPVSASDVRRYVQATGDDDPAWLDDAAAQAAGYPARVLPPMMVITLSWKVRESGSTTGPFKLPMPAGYSDIRNANTEIEWFDDVRLGDTLFVQERIVDIEARRGSRGVGIYITRVVEYRTQHQRLAAQVRQTAVALPKPGD